MNAGAHERADPPPWTGPWADDARRLFQLLQTVAEHAGSPSGQEASAAPPGQEPAGAPSGQAPAGAPGAEHPAECRYCPLCQGVGLLRRAGPDVLDQVSEFAAGLAATLRATEPAPGPPPADPPAEPPGGPTVDRTSAPARPPSTVRIDVTD